MASPITSSPLERGAGADSFMETPVRDIMAPGVVTIVEDASLVQVYRAIVRHDVHAILVVGHSEGRPLGWVTARGLLSWIAGDSSMSYARDAIVEQPVRIEPSATCSDAIAALSQAGVTHLLVSHSHDSLPEGVVSDLDVVAHAAG
jgi:CBS domain-containing protein